MLHFHEKMAPFTNYARVGGFEWHDLAFSIDALIVGIHGFDHTQEY
jgi:hypothetical protein|tara:strand:+ start:371 stop:508 length:138 start_codon:yes stop_codon:yes gene_type:complete